MNDGEVPGGSGTRTSKRTTKPPDRLGNPIPSAIQQKQRTKKDKLSKTLPSSKAKSQVDLNKPVEFQEASYSRIMSAMGINPQGIPTGNTLLSTPISQPLVYRNIRPAINHAIHQHSEDTPETSEIQYKPTDINSKVGSVDSKTPSNRSVRTRPGSTTTKASSTTTVRKNEILLEAKERFNNLQDEIDELELRFDKENHGIENLKKSIGKKRAELEVAETANDDGIIAELSQQIQALETELEEKQSENEITYKEYKYIKKKNERSQELIQEKTFLNLEKLALDEETEEERLGNLNLIDSEDEKEEEVRNHNTTEEWVTQQTNDLHQQQEAADKAAEEAEAELRELEEQRRAEEAEEKADEEKRQLEAALKQSKFEEAQRVLRMKIAAIEAKPFELRPKNVGTNIPQSTKGPSNQTDMVCKLLEMQLKLMEKDTPVNNNNSHYLARQTHAKDLPYFGGRPEEWPTFKAEYERSSKDCAFSNSENLSRLRKCLKGEAFKAVQCLMVAPENLPKVLKTLEDRFGQPGHIIQAMINKAKTVPSVKEEKLETLVEFGTAVQNVTMSIISLKCDEHLQNPQLLMELEAKLPATLRMNWVRWVMQNGSRKKDLKYFSDWLEEETRIACVLCPPKTEPEERKRPGERNRGRYQGETVMATTSNPKPNGKGTYNNNNNRTNQNSNNSTPSTRQKKCVFCSNLGHRISDCRTFAKKPLDDRWKFVKENNLCSSCLFYGHNRRDCFKKKTCEKEGCQREHHTLLHKYKNETVDRTEETPEATNSNSEEKVLCHAKNETFITRTRINLQILPVKLQGPKGTLDTFAMLDGGANVTLIDMEVSKKLGLKGPTSPLTFSGLHPIAQETGSKCVSLKIMPIKGNKSYQMANVRTVRNLPLPHQSIRKNVIAKYPHLQNLEIESYEGAQPKILIGLDHLGIMVIREVVEGPPNAPCAVRTNLGWTLLNQNDIPDNNKKFSYFCHEKDELHQLVKGYFSTDSFGVKPTSSGSQRSKEDKRAQELMDSTMKRVPNENRFVTGLLWKADDIQLPESKSQASTRLKSIEKKLDRDEEFAEQYYAKLQHYIDKKYAIKLTPEEASVEGPRTWYLPHFGNKKPSNPKKIRICMDAAAKSNGVALNDVLLKGEDQVNPLPSVLYQFRENEVAVTGDIREMFHQVKVVPEDQDSLRFLWRGRDRSKDPETYRMQVMMFGATCSPVCAQEAKNRNAREYAEQYPEAALAIIKKHYVDDWLQSFSNTAMAIKVVKDVVKVHLLGGFEIVNLMSNFPEVMESLDEKIKADEPKSIDSESINMDRVLGLYWDRKNDTFSFTINFHRVTKEVVSGESIPSKKEALSLIMSIYDPLGFLAHFTIKARILMQETWKSEVGWNDEIPSGTHRTWLKWIEELQRIPAYRLPRCYDREFSSSPSIQLHIFCDASQKAFAAVAYFRIVTSSGVKVAFVGSKARVAPLKTLTMPKLELQGQVLGTRLAISIKEQHEIKPTETHYWTDSYVGFCWVSSDGNKCPPFIAHRIGEIQESTNAQEWHWLPGKLNPADEATRDDFPTKWDGESRWVKGPDFLLLPEQEWPKKSKPEILGEIEEEDLQYKKPFVGIITEKEPLLDPKRHSAWNQLRRITAWILRAAKIFRMKKPKEKHSRSLIPSEIQEAEIFLCKQSQQDSFEHEMHCLQNGQPLPKSNPKHPVTVLIIRHFHEAAGHQGQERVVNEIRQQYHILNVRAAVKSCWSHCQKCKNDRAVPILPQMGLIPDCKLQSYIRPFTHTGLDYFGPMEVTIGRRHEKRYGALFTCMTTRAVHVEIASSISTDSCIMAIRRMAAVRGNPHTIYSDNGTNFHGADNELKKALQELDQDKIHDDLCNLAIEWKFIPPGAPHMGGSWERLVRSIKSALSTTLKSRYPKEEVLYTLMKEAEHMVNSRPLTHVPYDPNDQEALTPNHFLIGCSSNMQPPGNFDEKEICLKSQWRATQALTNSLWKVWVKDYMPTLTRRTKWHKPCKPIEVGDVAIIIDNNMTRNCWPKGIITAIYPGRDGQVRVADVKISDGNHSKIYKRPVSKIAVLDVRNAGEETGVLAPRGSVSAESSND